MTFQRKKTTAVVMLYFLYNDNVEITNRHKAQNSSSKRDIYDKILSSDVLLSENKRLLSYVKQI
jgi:hypothetical protein